MLINASKLIGVPVLSVQVGGPVARTKRAIIDPENLKIIGFEVDGPLVKAENILDVESVREFSKMGMVIDSAEELVTAEDVIRISEVLKLNFDLIGLKVETKKHSKLGRISGFTVTENDFMVQQLIVKRPTIKSFLDAELVIPRSEIVEIDDYKVVVKDEEKKIKEKVGEAEFVPNFVNPFRKTAEPD